MATLGGGDAGISLLPRSVDESGRYVVGVSHESGSDRRSAFEIGVATAEGVEFIVHAMAARSKFLET